MLKQVEINLMMGPVIPVPVPKEIVEALVSVEVHNETDKRSGFQLVFSFDGRSTLNTVLLLLTQMGPAVSILRAVITVIVNGTPSVLMDGVITHHQVTPDTKTGRATLTLTGEDLSAVMDMIDFTGLPFPCLPAEARVALILLKYAIYGIIPLVIPSLFIDVPIPIDRIPSQQGTDLAYMKSLAEEVGYVFYVEPGPVPLTNTAYWGPETKVGVPQPALNVNMDAYSNVESLDFSFDGLHKTLPVVFIQNQQTKIPIPIPIPDLNPLQPPLGAVEPIPSKIEFLNDTAKMSPMQAIMIGLAEASKTSDTVTGTGSLDVVRYGRILKSRGLVGVRGAGQAYDGLYYVKNVTHKIKRGEYKQSFTLTRNGLVSITPQVPA